MKEIHKCFWMYVAFCFFVMLLLVTSMMALAIESYKDKLSKYGDWSCSLKYTDMGLVVTHEV